jgi:hypothetical protein
MENTLNSPPKYKSPTKSTPQQRKITKIKIIYLRIIYGEKNNSSSVTCSTKKKIKKSGKIKKAAHIPYTLEGWKFREITISLDIAGLQKLRIIIVQGQFQHIFFQ